MIDRNDKTIEDNRKQIDVYQARLKDTTENLKCEYHFVFSCTFCSNETTIVLTVDDLPSLRELVKLEYRRTDILDMVEVLSETGTVLTNLDESDLIVSLAASLSNADVYEGMFAGTNTFATLVAKALIFSSHAANAGFVPRVPLLVVRSIANEPHVPDDTRVPLLAVRRPHKFGSYAKSICKFVNEIVKSTESMSSSGFEMFLAHIFTLKVRCFNGKMFLFSLTFFNTRSGVLFKWPSTIVFVSIILKRR
jgi:hypothetical protein